MNLTNLHHCRHVLLPLIVILIFKFTKADGYTHRPTQSEFITNLADVENGSKCRTRPTRKYIGINDNGVYDCSNLNLSTLPVYIPSNITELNLHRNNIETLSADAFISLRSLKRLILSYNSLRTLHSRTFRGLENLEYLNLEGNPIEFLVSRTVNILSSLIELNLSNANLTFLERSLVRGLNNLRILRLSRNPLYIAPWLGYNAAPFVPNLKELHLQYTKITRFNLRHVQKLEVLDLCFNQLRELRRNQFEHLTRLEILHMKFCGISTLEPTIFAGLHRLKVLNLSNNKFGVLKKDIFRPLVSLEILYLEAISIVEFSTFSYYRLPNLKELYLQSNNIHKLPLFVTPLNESSLPNLRILNLDKNSLDDITSSSFRADRLEELSLRSNRFKYIFSDSFINFPNLKRVYLASNALTAIDSDGFRSNTLEEIDISETASIHDRYAYKNIEDSLFHYTPNLRILDISSSYVDPTMALQNLANLRVLKANDMEMTSLDDISLINTTGIEELELSNNNVLELDAKFFEPLINLRKLMLTRNKIKRINQTSLPIQYWSNLQYLDLSQNPFSCDCHLLWFRNWLRNTKIEVESWNDTKKYSCDTPIENRGKFLLDNIPPTIQECFFLEEKFLKILVFCLLIFYLVSFTVAGLHRYRWHVRYWKYIVTAGRRRQADLELRVSLPYDAFIAYSQSDSKWVVNELLPHLERPEINDEPGLRLCVHQRDWLAGRDIMDNVINSVQSSRKTVLVVSNAFTRSDWCHVELTIAQSRLYQDERDSLVIILLESLEYSYVNPRLRYEMDRRTYIEWPENSEVGQELFWLKLRRTLETPSPV